MATADKVRAVQIRLYRAEGYSHECIEEIVGDDDDPWAGAKAILDRWALTAPRSDERIGVHKTDFQVTWADGEEYEGTFGLMFDDTDLPAHIRGHVQHVIDHRETYEGPSFDINVDDYVKFLATYEIGRL